MEENIKKLKEIIDGSDNIVFFGGAGVSTEIRCFFLMQNLIWLIKL